MLKEKVSKNMTSLTENIDLTPGSTEQTTPRDYNQTDLSRMDSWKVKFGKHKGLTFNELLNSQTEYCDWVQTKFDETDALRCYITRKRC